jgi:hypothetical protein
MSGMTQTNTKQFNPFNNEFECNICYEYCYGDKQDCKTCSGAICNECMKGLNENDALRNKCVTCRSPLETVYQANIAKNYGANLAFFSQEKRERISDITAFFRHDRDKKEISISELSWYFINVLPLHPKDNGRKIFERGQRMVHEALFPESKTAYFDTSNRDSRKWKVGNNHRILCYHANLDELSWTNKTAIIHKVNDKSIKLSKGYNRPDDNLSRIAYDSIDNEKRYKKAYDTIKFTSSSMMGCKMGASIIIHKSYTNEFIYFINIML